MNMGFPLFMTYWMPHLDFGDQTNVFPTPPSGNFLLGSPPGVAFGFLFGRGFRGLGR